MDNPGIYTFTSAVTTATTEVTNAIEELDGMLSALLDFQFVWGAGGTTCKGYAQYTLDDGATWRDAACASFTTAAAIKPFNVSALTEKLSSPAAPTDGGLADDTALSGMLGPKWRLKRVSTGTYTGSTQLVLRINAR